MYACLVPKRKFRSELMCPNYYVRTIISGIDYSICFLRVFILDISYKKLSWMRFLIVVLIIGHMRQEKVCEFFRSVHVLRKEGSLCGCDCGVGVNVDSLANFAKVTGIGVRPQEIFRWIQRPFPTSFELSA